MLNFNQYNGSYGCSHCEHPGESIRTDKGGTVYVIYNYAYCIAPN